MKKSITIEEKLTYYRTMIVEMPDESDLDEYEDVLSAAEDEANLYAGIDAMYGVLNEGGLKIINYPDDSLDSPSSCEYSIDYGE